MRQQRPFLNLLVQVGGTIYILDTPLKYLLCSEAKKKIPPPPFTAFAVKASLEGQA